MEKSMDRASEIRLVEQAQQGDPASFERLVTAYSSAVAGIAYRRVGDFESSEDISHDAFLIAFEKLPSLRRPQLFAPWLRAITLNLCARWHRNRSYRQRLEFDSAAVCARLGYRESGNPAVHA